MDAQTQTRKPLYVDLHSTGARLAECREIDATIGRLASEAEALACSASHLLADVLKVKHSSVKVGAPHALITDLYQTRNAVQHALAELTNGTPDAGRTDPNEPLD